MNIERPFVWNLLCTHVQDMALLKHCLAVEIAMRAYAEKFDLDPEYWGAVGLLHDVDFEKYPEEHLLHTEEILKPEGYDQAFIDHIRSHSRNWDQPRDLMEQVLLAVDEMTGFVIACALVRPDRSLDTLEVRSVLKKMKDKAFARSVNRITLQESAKDLGVEFSEHIAFVIQALSVGVKKPQYQELPLV